MVNAVYDHIFAIIIVGIIFVSAVVALPAMSLINIRAVDQQQLRNIALNVFNAILLDTGEPVNWGSVDPNWSPEIVKRFGLASASASTFYVLDPDKVQRLVEGNPLGGINYTVVKELLGLEGYEFSFRIIPPFNVTNVDGTKIDDNHSPINETLLEEKVLQYAVKVCYPNGEPIPNAVIEAVVVYTDKSNFAIESPKFTTTDSMGIGRDTINLDFKPSHVTVILRVSVADVATLVVTFGKNPLRFVDINAVGDSIVLTRPKNKTNAEVKLHKIYFFSADGTLVSLYNGTKDDHFNTGVGSPFRLWNKTFPCLKSRNPVVFVINIETVPPKGSGEHGNQEMVIAGPYQNLLGYTVFQYGSSSPPERGAVSLRRSVIISGMTYTAELTLWKESP